MIRLLFSRVIPDLNKDSELSYVDIYNYTNYVYNSLINDCWVTNLSKVIVSGTSSIFL